MTTRYALLTCILVFCLSVVSIVLLLPQELSSKLKIPFSVPGISSSWTPRHGFTYGLDIQGGTQVVLLANMDAIPQADRLSALESARDVISRRIDLYGVAESTVLTSRSGDQYRLVAEIPGVKEAAEVVSLIGSTASLEFRELADKKIDISSPSAMLAAQFVPSGINGKDLQKAEVLLDQTTRAPMVSLVFTGEGKDKFATVTKRNIGLPIAIFIDEYPVTSPIVQQAIIDGRATINGNFTLDQAKQLAISLNAGVLPVPITILEQRTVSPTLGMGSVEIALRAGAVGIGLVMLYMILLYGYKGILSSLSLAFYGLLTSMIYMQFPVALSLAGVAGFLLSIGMAVDASILIFERLAEEEQKGGASTRRMIQTACGRAWGTIKDANITTLLVTLILANPFGWSFLATTGFVRGFAVTLGIGVVLNMLTGMVVTRSFLLLFYRPKRDL